MALPCNSSPLNQTSSSSPAGGGGCPAPGDSLQAALTPYGAGLALCEVPVSVVVTAAASSTDSTGGSMATTIPVGSSSSSGSSPATGYLSFIFLITNTFLVPNFN
jgi:hypothetical protein